MVIGDFQAGSRRFSYSNMTHPIVPTVSIPYLCIVKYDSQTLLPHGSGMDERVF